jgi:hypothetical protein
MENIYTKFESAFNNSEINKGSININLMALGLAVVATGLHIALVLAMFAR